MSIWQRIGYKPSPEQIAAHDDAARLKLVAGGERAGKSYSAGMELVRKCDIPDGLFWVVGPTYELARPEYNYVAAALADVNAIKGKPSWPAKGACSLTTRWGATIETRSSDDPVKLAGLAPDGVLMCEAAQQDYEAWLRLRGRVAEKRGWLWASGTFEGSLGWYADTWKRWQADNPEGGRSFSLPSWSNLALYPGGRADPEIAALAATYPADLFMERFGAVPCPPSTLVFREFSFGLHVDASAEYTPLVPVELAIDPGYAGAYAVLAMQRDGDYVRCIDEVYLAHAVAQEVIDECKSRPWWGDVTGGVIDIAGRQHAGLPSHVEIWQHEAGLFLRANKVGISDGIARLRTFLVDPGTKAPRITFAPHCRNTFAEFGRYKYAAVVENRPVKEEPIDADNHALKALSYYLYDRFGPVARNWTQPTAGSDPFAVLRPEAKEPERIGLVPTETGMKFGKVRRNGSGLDVLKFGR